MDYFITFSLLLCFFSYACVYVLTSRRPTNLPPGPPPLPIIGNILQLGHNLHQTLTHISKIYGPIMYLKLGTIYTVVVSSPELAKQVLQKHDQVLSGRFQPAVTDIEGHNKASVAWLPADGRWRALRRICKDQMFSLQRLDASRGLRREKLKKLRDYVQECCDSSRAVDIADAAFDLFVAGIDTTATTVEWTMAELIRNPKKMTLARNELQTVIGENNKVEESDISRLPYLQAIIKVTFRIHSPGPLLIPHKAEADTEINGYTVPQNAQILVNIWAIGREPGIWPNPDSFEPERFLDNKIDIKGQDFKLIPFGSGKRMFPGMPLAHCMVHLVVATLIHTFEWKLENGVKPQELNMGEKFGLSLKKVTPLKVVPVRPYENQYL